MELAPTPELEELRGVVRSFFEMTSPESEVRRLMVADEAFDRDLWRRMATEIGLQGLAVSESLGGQGYGFRELSVVLEEAGRALVCAPVLSTVVSASTLLAAVGDPAADDLLAAIATGDVVVAVAVPCDRAGFETASLDVRAEAREGAWRLNGSVDLVIDGHVADEVLVVAATSNGPGVFSCPADADGLEAVALPTLDLTRPAATLTFHETPGAALGEPGTAGAAVTRTLDVTCAALAMESVGGAQRCLEMAVAYAKERVQFGRPIGSFQAVKHRCADMLLAVETARSTAQATAWAVDATSAGDGEVDLAAEASLAKAVTGEAYVDVADANIQVHGGIGFTWEHPAHLYLKRARSNAALFGDATDHRARLGDRVDL